MELFNLHYEGQKLSLIATPSANQQQLYLNDKEFGEAHPFSKQLGYELRLHGIGQVKLVYNLDMHKGLIKVRLSQQNNILLDLEQSVTGIAVPQSTKPAKNWHLWAWAGIGLKMLKSVKVIKVALAALSLGAWGIFLSWEFAFAIIGILVFHEYGHLRAMQKFGIPTKGIYLIPFVGGVAVGDRPRSHWQEVYIAMMGPVFGLLMTLIFALIYYFTSNHFAGLVASVGALVNLFNLLPVLPLDGGRVFKAMALSGQGKAGFITVIILTVAGLIFSVKMGFGLVTFFFIMGILDLSASWYEMKTDPLVSMDRYGIAFSMAWFLITAGSFITIIVMMAGTGLPGTELAATILRDS
jgi:putative peptide zinc metalloprotease protein